MMVDKTGVGPEGGGQQDSKEEKPLEEEESQKDKEFNDSQVVEKSSGNRTKSNQRWMKLRTTVQISSAVGSKNKPSLKREDSFLKRFSTRQVPQTQETLDTGDDGEGCSGSQTNLDESVVRRKRKRRLRHPRSVVNPDENFYFYWLLVITICVLYNLWTLIVRQSFPELQMTHSVMWFSCDAVTDVVFLCDVLVQFRTGYLEQGLMVYNSKKLAGHYIKSNAFLFDLMALLPLDLLQFNVGINPILRFPRFLKVYRVYDYYYMVESRTVYPNLWRVINLIHILLVLAHWFGCFYYLLSEAEGFQGDWVYPYRPGEYATLTRKYLGSLYWSTLTLTTIGDLPTPETNADASTDGLISIPRRGHKSRLLRFRSNSGYIFTIVSYLIGMFIFATIVGQVGNVITNRNANRLEFERLLDGAKTYMRHHKVPGGMKRRVLRWYDYSWSRGRIQGGGDINTALGLLPDKLKTELALHVNLSVLKKVTIFQECQPEFLHDLVLKMKAYIFTPGDLICRKGEVAREMFIIADGILEVISESGRVLTTMKAGDFFGEIGILNLDGLNKRTADVRSVGYSELFSLSREDVLTAMKDYPEAQEILQSLGRKRLMEARNINKNFKAGMHDKRKKQGSPPSPDSGDHKTGKRIVDKIRSDVKELRNVLRKSRRGTRTKDESLELQPLTTVSSQSSSHSNKGLLRRMPRVWSDETSQEEDSPVPSSESKGIRKPLLKRLKIYKEPIPDRADESKEKEKCDESRKSASLEPVHSETTKEPEPIGAGLPLLQRLLLLKQKEDRETREIKNAASSAADILASTVKTQPKTSAFKVRKKIKETALPIFQTTTSSASESAKTTVSSCVGKKESTVDKNPDSQEPGNENNCSSKGNSNRSKGAENKLSCKTEDSNTPWCLLKKATVLSTSTPSNVAPKHIHVERTKEEINNLVPSTTTVVCSPFSSSSSTSSAVTVTVATSSSYKTNPVDNYRHVRINSIAQSFTGDNNNILSDTSCSGSSSSETLTKTELDNKLEFKTELLAVPRHLLLANKPSVTRVHPRNKLYKSVDDLSPEYSGLPFVKRLKILNERQKLAELERDDFLRSTSLDSSGENENNFDSTALTRSHSEAIAIEVVLRNQQFRNDKTIRPSALPNAFSTPCNSPLVSPESNETPERKNLKSILKKLSSNNLFKRESEEVSKNSSDPSSSATIRVDPNIKKLMRAQTFEGYAARHSKLTKSVTFNRDTLQSPPASALSPTAKDAEVHSFLPIVSSNEESSSNGATLAIETEENAADRVPRQIENSVSPSRNPDLIPDVDRIPTGIDSGTPIDVIAAQLSVCVTTNAISTMPSIISHQSVSCSTQTDLDDSLVSQEDDLSFSKPVTLAQLQYKNSVQKSFRPESILKSSYSFEEEYYNEILNGIKIVIQGHLEDVQTKFKLKISTLEKEVRKKDEIIKRLQRKIYSIESEVVPSNESDVENNSDISSDFPDLPFVRDDSVDTVVGTGDEQSWPEEPRGRGIGSLHCSRRSWEDHSEEENLELLDLPRSITPQPMWTTVEIGSDSSESDDTFESDGSPAHSDHDLRFRHHDCDWEVQMLARELDRRDARKSYDLSSQERKIRFRRCRTRSAETDNNQLSDLFSTVALDSSNRLFVLNPKSLTSFEINPPIGDSKLRNDSVPRSLMNLSTGAQVEESGLLYQKSLSIGSLQSSLSNSVRRGFRLLRNDPPVTTPSSSISVLSPDIVSTISQACPTPPPPPNI